MRELTVGDMARKSETRISKSETNPKPKIREFNLVFLIGLGFRYSYFEFTERLRDAYRFSIAGVIVGSGECCQVGLLLKEALDIVEKGKDHEAEEQQHSNLLGKLTLAFSERTAQDGFTG